MPWASMLMCLLASPSLAQSLQLDFIDKDTGDAVPCRVDFTKSPGKQSPKPRGALQSGTSTLFEGTAKLKVAAGDYELSVFRGSEFSDVSGGFGIVKDTPNQFQVIIVHQTKMNDEHWYSGDLNSRVPVENLSRWAAADAINMAVSTVAGNGIANSAPHHVVNQQSAGEETSANFFATTSARTFATDREGVLLRLHPIRQEESSSDFGAELDQQSMPAWIPVVEQIERGDYVFELANIWERDLPIVLATIDVDAVQVLSTHLQPTSESDVKTAFYNPDPIRFGNPHGMGRLVEHIYWQLLEAGFRIAPSAGSGFDARGKTYVGYNRVYAYLNDQQEKTPEQWWTALREGFSTVSNGPLLRMLVNGYAPGGVHQNKGMDTVRLNLNMELSVRDDVDYLDVIFNGRPMYQSKLEDHARRGTFPALEVKESGWMMMRVVTSYPDSYRLVFTAPTYYEMNGVGRISRSAVQFFQAWLAAAEVDLQKNPEKLAQYAPMLKRAKRFWADRAVSANAP